MTLPTVNALAASARAYLARAVTPSQARAADRQAVPNEDAVRQGHRNTPSADRAADDAQDDDGLDTGALVARFFDVLQAAAQAGGGSPMRVADAEAAADAASATGEGSTPGAPGAVAAPLDGVAMAVPWERSWSAQDTLGSDSTTVTRAIGSRGAVASVPGSLDAGPSGVVAATPGAAGMSSSVTEAPDVDVSSGTSSAAIAGAWPLYGPPASKPSARDDADPSARKAGRVDADIAGAGAQVNATASAAATTTSATANPITASLATADGAPDRPHRTTAAVFAEPTGRADTAAPSSRSVDALWPWPSTSGAASTTHGALSLPAGSPVQWREALSQALGDRLQLTLGQGGDQAAIRLDPPLLGRIDLAIRQDGGALTVHLSASNPDVLRQLQAMGDGLRQDLSHRHAGDLTVTVAPHPSRSGADADARQHGSQGGDETDSAAPGRALAEADADGAGAGDARGAANPREARRAASFASLTRTFGAA